MPPARFSTQVASQSEGSAPPAQTPATSATPQNPTRAPAPTPSLRVVVLNPGHGGTDSGARGATGTVEKDVTLMYAQVVRAEIEKLGMHVVLTRDGDQNPSFDERAATANAQHSAIFLSFHVSSTGPAGTVRAYSDQFSDAEAGAAQASRADSPYALTNWNLAQEPEADLSRRLADLVQVECARRFPGSPEISSSVSLRELRSVALPAVAIEVSSVSVADAATLTAMAPNLAQAVAHAVDAFRPVYAAAQGK
jgi:N-acetylmuramoyl-L-alanine amidase